MKKLFVLLALFCSYSASQAQQTIADFESWRNYTVITKPLIIPTGWNASDSLITNFGMLTNPGGVFVQQIAKEIPGANGSGTAIKVMSANQGAVTGFLPAGPTPCIATNAFMGVDQTLGFTFTGGLPFYSNPTSASFWVKTNPLLGDSTEFSIQAIDNSDGDDSLVSFIDTTFGGPIATWTQITMPFTVNNASFNTTLLRVIVSSSSNPAADSTAGFLNVHNGSYIAVDDIQITAPNGVVNLQAMENVVKVYPTRVDDLLHIDCLVDCELNLQIHDQNGSLVLKNTLNAQRQDLDVSRFCAGSYVYSVFKGPRLMQSGRFIKQ